MKKLISGNTYVICSTIYPLTKNLEQSLKQIYKNHNNFKDCSAKII